MSDHSNKETLVSHVEQAMLYMILPSHAAEIDNGLSSYLDWYPEWIHTQVANLPAELSDCIKSITQVFDEVALSVKTKHSLDATAQALLDRQLIISNGRTDAIVLARMTVFAIIGWQSMLYQADTTRVTGSLALTDTLEGYRSSAFFRIRPTNPHIGRPLADLLLDFGLMLPKAELCTSEETEDLEAFEDIKVVTPGCLNAAALFSLGQFNFKWVDTIAPHLELDKATNTIFLFQYPSFCLANMGGAEKETFDSVLHRCGFIKPLSYSVLLTMKYSLSAHTTTSGLWACPEEVTQLLREVMLSYRLLFGQNKQSRKLFGQQSMRRQTGSDGFLHQLCAKSRMATEGMVRDKESYRLTCDFPILRQRIAILQHQLSHVKPRGWRAIWSDRRNSVQWYTFWAVIMFGGIGTFLAAAQTVLQGIETFRQD